MSEPTQPPTNPPTVPVGLSDETLNRLSTVLENVGNRVSAPPPPTSDDVVDEEIQKLDPDVATAVVKIVEKKTRALEEKYVKYQRKKDYNKRLDDEFPEIANQNSTIYKEAVKELRKRMEDNPRYVDEVPSAFYDAACAAAARIGYSKKTSTPPTPSPEDRRISSITGGYMPSGNPPPPVEYRQEELTPEQAHYAERFNLPSDVYQKFEGTIDQYGRVITTNPGRKK